MTMNNSLLTAAVVGVLSSAVSGAAFSDNQSTYCKPGFYAGLSGGRTDTMYSTTKAFGSVNYNGAGAIVPTVVIYNTMAPASIDDIGIGGRIYAGYQFNPYVAVEAGYTQFAKTDFSATGVVRLAGSNSFVNEANYAGEITEHAVDLVAKGTLPVAMVPGFGLFAKLGMAFIAADNHINANGIDNNPPGIATPPSTNGINDFTTVYTRSSQRFSPVAGAGLSYTIPNTNINVGGSYTRIFSYGDIPNASLLSADLEYKFA